MPDWQPNWLECAAYPNPSKTSPAHWAWEFLRRRPDYQQDYDTLVKPAVGDDGSIGDGRVLRLMKERYGLSFPYAPSRAPDPQIAFIFLDSYVSELRSWAGGQEPQSVLVKPGTVFIEFDLAQPLGPQLQRAALVIKEDQKHYLRNLGRSARLFRQRYQKWPLYLRLLDAEAAGVPIPHIAKHLFPRIENIDPQYAANDLVRKSLRAAKRLQSEYRAIAGLEAPGK